MGVAWRVFTGSFHQIFEVDLNTINCIYQNETLYDANSLVKTLRGERVPWFANHCDCYKM